jgi:hypothetical protein
MRPKIDTMKPSAEMVVKDIRRRTGKQHMAEEKIRIALEWIAASLYVGRPKVPRGWQAPAVG